MEPLIIEDVPSSVHEERMNPQYLSNTVTPIIEDAEHPTDVSVETHNNTPSDAHPA